MFLRYASCVSAPTASLQIYTNGQNNEKYAFEANKFQEKFQYHPHTRFLCISKDECYVEIRKSVS